MEPNIVLNILAFVVGTIFGAGVFYGQMRSRFVDLDKHFKELRSDVSNLYEQVLSIREELGRVRGYLNGIRG